MEPFRVSLIRQRHGRVLARGDESKRVNKKTTSAPNVFQAYAKVNLGLSVLGRRGDGYHEVSTLMTSLGLHDLILVEEGPTGLSVSCPGLPQLLQEENLVYKAVDALMRSSGKAPHFRITVDKRIPAGSGMGGGSSDAAAALAAVSRWAGSSGEAESLMLLAPRLGADVSFFLGCNAVPPLWEAALCTGVGHRVQPLPAQTYWLVVAVLADGVSTRWAFEQWDEFSTDRPIAKDATLKTEALLKAWVTGNAALLSRCIYNDLEEVVVYSRPDIKEAKQVLMESGALNAVMTGSGSAVYGIALSKTHAAGIRAKAARAFDQAQVTEVLVAKTGVGN